MRKELTAPLVSPVVPTLTFLIFLLLSLTMFLSLKGWTPSQLQPAGLHFCVTHQHLCQQTMFLIGLLCSLLNSCVTVVWTRHGRSSVGTHYQTGEIAPQALFLGGVFVVVALLTAAAYLYQAYYGPQGLSHGGVLNVLIVNYLLPLGMVILLFGSIIFVAATALSSVFEFFNRLKQPAPRL